VCHGVLAPFLITRRMRDNSKQIASISNVAARRDSCDVDGAAQAAAAAAAASMAAATACNSSSSNSNSRHLTDFGPLPSPDATVNNA